MSRGGSVLARPLVLDPLWHLLARIETRDGQEFEALAGQVAGIIEELSEAVSRDHPPARNLSVVREAWPEKARAAPLL